MTIRARRRLFYGLFIAFFVLGIGVLVYVNGWRLDVKTFRLRKVGAIFVRSFPKDTKIFLDNKLIKNESWFLQNGTLVNNLFPKTYELKLELNNYQPWREHVSVQPTLVSELKYAVLVPKNSLLVSTSTVKNFWLLGNDLAVESENDDLVMGDTKIGKGKILGWTSDFGNLLMFNPETNAYSWNNLSDARKVNLNALLKRVGFRLNKDFKIIVDPEDRRRLIILEPRAFSLLDVEQSKLLAVYKTGKNFLENIVASQFLFVWTEFNEKQNTSSLVIYDKFLQRTRPSTPTFQGKNLELAWIKSDKLAVLQDDGALYTYDLPKKEVVKIADDVKNFAFANDGSALAALEHSALEVFFFNQDRDYYRFNLPDMGKAEKVVWYVDLNHLFVVYPQYVKFLDLQDTAVQNFTTVAETPLARYDEKNNWLYFLVGDRLKKLEFPE